MNNKLGRIYVTGDIHGQVEHIVDFVNKSELTENDIIIILGDVGLNYYGGKKDMQRKRALSKLKPTIFCIHGNHEKRPHHLKSYELIDFKGGKVWRQKAYPNILFAKDGEIYNFYTVITDHFENDQLTFTRRPLKCLVIGGAYSVDKHYRLANHYNWFEDEQPSDEIKAFVEKQLADNGNEVDIILSHTCPLKYEPTEVFLPHVDQSTVDKSTEIWLDKIEETTKYRRWYCGHFHVNKDIDNISFLYDRFKYLSHIPLKEHSK